MANRTDSVSFQHDLILQAWLCLIGDAKLTYISGPITTGLRWVEALVAGDDAGQPIISANCAAIHEVANRVRRTAGTLVLEPASLHVESWSQDDYLRLWTTLIERHASSVIFVEGWQYSIGCAFEFERAVLNQIPALAVDGKSISMDDGIELLTAAARTLEKKFQIGTRGADHGQRLREVAERLMAR